MYDDAGRMVSSRPEVEWDGEQYALVAALADVEADECSGCGQPMSESMSPDSDPDNKDATHHYVTLLPHRCFACDERERTAEKASKKAARPHLLRYPVAREERPTRRPKGE